MISMTFGVLQCSERVDFLLCAVRRVSAHIVSCE